ncbi:MAG: DegV family protein [Anaerolineae bacterium]|nr:DegV family protein [Candidatus Roseilinea sp.]MDW8449654.1 DegV family protein [Anaerolineae bacterium]
MTLKRTPLIRIVTDSAARLSPHWAQENDVIVLPQHIVLNGREYREDLDLSEADLAQQAIRSKQPFTVRAPSVEDFARVYGALADKRAEVISIHVSSALSETVQNALKAREAYLGRCKIHIIDSRSMALGLNELVQAAVKLAKRGETSEGIVKQLRGLMQHIYGIFISDDMEYLEHSKRLRPAQAILGAMLGIIPCLSMEEGDLVAVEKVRTSERAIEKVIEFVTEFDDHAQLAVLQLSPQPNDRTHALIEALQACFTKVKEIPVKSCGATVGRIIGPNGIGVMIYEGRI